MPLSYFKRPLVLAVLAYILLLALLKSRGFFRVEIPPDLRLPRAAVVEGTVLSGFSPKKLGDRIWLRAEHIEGLNPVFLRVMAYLPRAAAEAELERDVRPGQVVRLFGRLRAPRWPHNPGEFDEREFLTERGAALVLHAERLEILRAAPWFWRPWAAAEAAHRSTHDYLYARFPSSTAALLEGFLFGYKGSLPKELNRSIQDAGVMHLLVPSGAKVAFVLLFVLWLASRLGLPPMGRLLAAAAAGGFYVLMVGAEPPYTRAYFVALSLYATRLLDRESGNFSGVTLSAALTLALRPRALFSAGFQMTYLAVLGLLIAMPRWRLPRSWPRPARAAAYVLMASFVVQLALWPIFALRFGRGSVAGLAANVLLVPASGLVMAAGFLCWALSWLPISFPEAMAVGAAKGLIAGFIRICAFFSALPAAAWDLAPMTEKEILMFYLGALGLLLAPQWRYAAMAWTAALALGLASWTRIYFSPPRIRAVFFSQAAERSLLLTSPEGKNMLLDAGIRPAVLRDALRVLRVKRLEAIGAMGIRPSRLAGLDARILRPGQGLYWPGGRVVVHGKGARNSGVEVRYGRLRMTVGLRLARIWLAGPEGGDFCIMNFPSKYRRTDCAPGKSFFTHIDGAVTVYSDGERLEIKTQRELIPLGRAFL